MKWLTLLSALCGCALSPQVKLDRWLADRECVTLCDVIFTRHIAIAKAGGGWCRCVVPGMTMSNSSGDVTVIREEDVTVRLQSTGTF